MTTLSEVLGAVGGKQRLSAEDALLLRRAIFPDMTISRDEAEALFALNDRADSIAPEWSALFVEALTYHLVAQESPPGYVDEAKAAWLVDRIASDGRLKGETELELLIRIIETAEAAPALLAEAALTSVAEAALSEERREGDGPTLTSEEVGRIRRTLYAFADPAGGATVTRREAEVLFALNDAARGRPNSPEWSHLFVHAIGGSLLAAAGYRALPREEAARREAWLAAPTPGVGGLLAQAFGSLFKDPLAGFRPSADAYAERDARNALASAAAAQLDEAELAWVAAQIGKDGLLDPNEAALIDFLRREATAPDPALEDLLTRFPAAAPAPSDEFGRRVVG